MLTPTGNKNNCRQHYYFGVIQSLLRASNDRTQRIKDQTRTSFSSPETYTILLCCRRCSPSEGGDRVIYSLRVGFPLPSLYDIIISLQQYNERLRVHFSGISLHTALSFGAARIPWISNTSTNVVAELEHHSWAHKNSTGSIYENVGWLVAVRTKVGNNCRL